MGNIFPTVANLLLHNSFSRQMAARVLGIAPKAPLPPKPAPPEGQGQLPDGVSLYAATCQALGGSAGLVPGNLGLLGLPNAAPPACWFPG